MISTRKILKSFNYNINENEDFVSYLFLNCAKILWGDLVVTEEL